MAATLNDISQGGAALSCTLKLAPGTEVEVGLPGGDDLVLARVVRSNGAVMAVVFQQDPPVVARVDHAMKLVRAASAKTPGLAAA